MFYIQAFVVSCVLHYAHILRFGVHVLFWASQWKKNESSVNAFYTYEAPERPEVSIYACTCVSVLQLLSGPQRLLVFPWTASIDSTGFPSAPPPLFFFPSASFLLSSTFLVSLRFTLCLHTTLWVVLSFNIWSFPGPPCQEFLFFWSVEKCPQPQEGSLCQL